mmetsp:Transcript_6171/g.8885  ORF Transcript_6171/g.8885 Transcript_6171/m.8885 type:complete len:200 (-) Transcript_6171:1136-1735(-)
MGGASIPSGTPLFTLLANEAIGCLFLFIVYETGGHVDKSLALYRGGRVSAACSISNYTTSVCRAPFGTCSTIFAFETGSRDISLAFSAGCPMSLLRFSFLLNLLACPRGTIHTLSGPFDSETRSKANAAIRFVAEVADEGFFGTQSRSFATLDMNLSSYADARLDLFTLGRSTNSASIGRPLRRPVNFARFAVVRRDVF